MSPLAATLAGNPRPVFASRSAGSVWVAVGAGSGFAPPPSALDRQDDR